MTQLLIKEINTHNIQLTESYYTYKIIYSLPYIRLLGISLYLHDVVIKDQGADYKILINNKDTIQTLQHIEGYISKNTYNYKPITHHTNSGTYINIKKNDIISTNLRNYSDKSFIPIKLFKIRKTASHSYPIVYVL